MSKLSLASIICIVCIAFLFCTYGIRAQDDTGSPAPDESYFGQTPPGEQAVVFAPKVLVHEPHDSPLFSPDETWMMFYGMDVDVVFYEMKNGELVQTTSPFNFDSPDVCNGIAMTPDGSRFYIEEWKGGRGHLYYIEKNGAAWTAPTYVDLGHSGNFWQLSLASNGNIYFAVNTVKVSPLVNGAHTQPIPLKLEDNSDMVGGTPFISPDESYIIYNIDGNLHISYRRTDGRWTMPVDLGPNINSEQLDICPQISPNGKYLFFNSRRNFPQFAIYWADASFVEDLRPNFDE